jgi:PAS domain S-box-containing protein
MEAETLNAVALDFASELDVQTLLQKVTDAGTRLSAARFGAFFYNNINEQGESYLLYTLSGAPREAFEKFGMPRATKLFGPTFRGEGIVRIDDVSEDPRYGKNTPHRGMPRGHLPVRSYMAVPVKSRTGEVIGGLFFGHPEPAVFTERAERLILGIAAQAAVAIDNARLYAKAKDAEQALRATEQRLEAVLGSINDHLVSYDLQWRYTYVNDKAAAVLGRPKEELLGKCIWDLFPQAAGNQYYQELHQALAEQQVIRSEHYYEPFDAWFENHIYPTPDGVTVFAADITWRKRAEHALHESRQRFERFMQNLPGLAWIKDAQGRYIFANDAAVQAFQITREQLYGKTDAEVFPPEIAAQFRENDRRALASGSGIETLETLRHSDGIVHHSIVSKFPIFDETGRGALIGGIAIDITERKMAEIALQESENRFRMMANATPSLIWTAAPDGSITFLSDRWFEYSGFSREQELNIRSSILHPDDAERRRQVWEKALRDGTPYETEVRMRRYDGEYRWFISRAAPIRDEKGAIKGWFGSTTDIHDRKLAEQALQEADRRKDRFLATLAHELRNPLAPIRNSLHILRLGIGDGSIEQVHEMMERQVNHMVRLVDDLLEVSRITRGQIDLRKAPLDLAVVIQNAVETSRPLIEAAGHRLDISLPSGPVLLIADSVRLAQVFSNLLNNAAKYTGRGGQIRLEVRREKNTAVISVRDSGIGISADMLPHIFDMFSRANRGGHAGGGLGIGLALARSLVQMHGGRIEAHSEGAGRGSEFIVRLPLAADGVGPVAAAGTPPIVGTKTPRSILVVDDNRDAADSLCMLLRFLGNTVHVVHDGPAALTAIKTYRPGVVLLDLGMPGMSGYEVANAVRLQPGFADITLVALTGWGQEEDRKRTLSQGFNHHLVKPVDINTLQALLASFGN